MSGIVQTCRQCCHRLGIRRGYLCGVDVDDIFVYDSPKIVRIRDARLGLLYLTLVVLTAVYILLFQLLRDGGYLDRLEALGTTTRLTLQQPTVAGCNPNENDCYDQFKPLSAVDYCCKAGCLNNTDGSCACPGRQILSWNCRYLDGPEASLVLADRIVITTFVKEYTQRRNASCSQSTCDKLWINEGEQGYYIPGIRDYTVLVDHSLTMNSLNLFKTNEEMEGWMFVNGTGSLQQELCQQAKGAVTNPVDNILTETKTAPCYIRSAAPGGKDIISVDMLLRAMNLTLDEVVDGSDQTLRYDGLTVSVDVEYFNMRPWSGIIKPKGTVNYIYSLTPFVQNMFKTTDIVWLSYPNARVKRDVHGIRLNIVLGGRLGTFNFQSLLIHVTTSLTLLAISATVIKYLALYVLKHRSYYKEMLIQVSADFSDVRALEAMSNEELVQILEARQLPPGGTREQRILRILHSGRLWEGHSSLAVDAVARGDGPQLRNVEAVHFIES